MRDARILYKAFAAIGHRDKEQPIAALLAFQHAAQATHFIVCMSHDRDNVHQINP